jgi:menaquinone-specific isochorismate synthase
MKDTTRNGYEHGKGNEMIYTPEQALTIIARRLKANTQDIQQLPLPAQPRVLRFEAAVNDVDILNWLGAQKNETKIYFSGRDPGDDEVAGIGIADEIRLPVELDYARLFEHINQRLSPQYPHLRYYGGLAFAPGHIDDDWQSFGAVRFIIPRFEILLENSTKQAYFACNVVKGRDSLPKLLDELQQLDFDSKLEFLPPGQPLSRVDSPNHDRWVENLDKAIADIKENKYMKTVLARKAELEFEKRPDSVALLSFLKHLPTRRYDFLFQFEECSAFVGSSPERLYKRKDRRLESEAVAGTRSRGREELDDNKLAKELMDSDKEQREHDFVIRTIEDDLVPLCTSLEVEQKKGLLKLREGQHLITHLNGVLKENVGDGQLIAALHPTPAVGGCPLEEALQSIAECEPFKRGWYAGIIGAVGHDHSDFAVALRSGRIHHNNLSLYSGVGIVEGSIPAGEWKEVEYKIVNFIDIINRNL